MPSGKFEPKLAGDSVQNRLGYYIYVSAFQFGGKPMALLQLALAGDVQIAISEPILKETIRVLREKFEWSPPELSGVLAVIDACTYRVTPKRTLHIIAEDEPDNRVLECAVEGACEYIVSRDLHLLRRGMYEGIQILKVGEFLDRDCAFRNSQRHSLSQTRD